MQSEPYPYIIVIEYPEGDAGKTTEMPSTELALAKQVAQDYVIKTNAVRAAVTVRETGEVVVSYVKQEED